MHADRRTELIGVFSNYESAPKTGLRDTGPVSTDKTGYVNVGNHYAETRNVRCYETRRNREH